MIKYQSLKKACYEANMQLPKLGLVVYTFGNVSCADRERGVFAIKPSGVPYETLQPDDMVILSFDNKVVEGDLNPSSDTKTHAYLYRNWPEVGGISHTHATYSVAWAQAQRSIPVLGTTHADHLPEDVPCAPPLADDLIEGDYEENTGKQIVGYFRKMGYSYQEIQMILLGNHGPFTWGIDAHQAVYNSRVLEELAKMAYLTLTVNPEAARLKNSLIKKHYERKHGSDAYYGQIKNQE